MLIKYSAWIYVPDSENNNLPVKDMVEIANGEFLIESMVEEKIVNYLCKKYSCQSGEILDLKWKKIDSI